MRLGSVDRAVVLLVEGAPGVVPVLPFFVVQRERRDQCALHRLLAVDVHLLFLEKSQRDRRFLQTAHALLFRGVLVELGGWPTFLERIFFFDVIANSK